MIYVLSCGRLAQLDRVQASEAWGREFESHTAHQLYEFCLLLLMAIFPSLHATDTVMADCFFSCFYSGMLFLKCALSRLPPFI